MSTKGILYFFLRHAQELQPVMFIVHWLISTSRKRIQLRFQVVGGQMTQVGLGLYKLVDLETTKSRINIASIRFYHVNPNQDCIFIWSFLLNFSKCDKFSMVVVDLSSLRGPKSLGGCLFSICFRCVTQGKFAKPTGSASRTPIGRQVWRQRRCVRVGYAFYSVYWYAFRGASLPLGKRQQKFTMRPACGS